MTVQVLIVDDNVANLKLARLALAGEGYDVRVAADGEEALLVLRDLTPRLILMDIQLPGIDGLELTRRLKADPATREILIVAVTAYAMKGDEERALAAGCDGYITKPLDPIQLPHKIAEYLARAPALPVRAPPVSGAPTPTGALVLIVDDNPATRKVFRLALETAGYQAVEAATGQEALALAAVRRPALILQDLILPDSDGLELARALQAQAGDEPIPIFCVSGFLSKVERARTMESTFAHVFLKPVDPLQLLDVIHAHLEPRVGAPAELGQGRSILVVDDDPLQLELARFWFSKAGFRVTTAPDGAAALETARRDRPDAILSDVLMPRIDGFELCIAVRRDPELRAVPIVLVSSAYVERADRALAERAGASAYLSKTEGIEAAAAAVAAALSSSASPPEDSAPPIPSLAEEHSRRARWQLERQILQNARLAQRAAIREAQLAVLAGVAKGVAAHQDLNQVLADALAACLDIAGISKGALYLFGAGDALELAHQIGFSEVDLPRVRCAFDCAELFRDVARRGQVVTVAPADVPAEVAAKLVIDRGATALLLVPIAAADTTHGLLVLGARTAEIAGEDALIFARVLGTQLGQALGFARTFAELAESEARFRSLVEALDERVFTLDRNQIVTGAYGRWLARTQVSAGDIVGKRIDEVLDGDANAHREANARALAGETVVYEWTSTAAGDVSSMQTSVSPLIDSAGRIQGAVRVSRNVSEQTRMQAQLMASDRMASVGTLAAGVAHEINNPLAAVHANLEYAASALASGAPLRADDLREALGDALEGSNRVRDIVRDLKIFSRAEEDRRLSVDIRRVLDSTLRMAWNEIRHRAQLVKTYGDSPPVDGNESRLGQVFLNLVVNAAQAIPEGNAASNYIYVTSGTDASGRVLVSIRDTGPGIPPDTLRRLFTPFFTTKPKGVGTGLGLTICQRIISALGGEITVESEVGVGTTFKVFLPPASAPVQEEVRPSAAPRARRRGRILVVDDDQMVATAVRRVLGSEHHVVAYANGEEALAFIAAGGRFDVILCDLMMPTVTGTEFHERLEQLARDQAERIVFLTGGAFTVRAREFLDRVPNPRVEKPFDVQGLRSLVNGRVR